MTPAAPSRRNAAPPRGAGGDLLASRPSGMRQALRSSAKAHVVSQHNRDMRRTSTSRPQITGRATAFPAIQSP